MTACPIDGGFQLTMRTNAPTTWSHADPEIHVPASFLASSFGRSVIETRYDIGEPCPHAPETAHARLHEQTPRPLLTTTYSNPKAAM